MDKFGDRIRAARNAIGLRQADVAKRLGYDQSMVSKWERGEIEPSRADYIALAKVLNADPAYLMALEGSDISLSQEQIAVLSLGWELARFHPDVRAIALTVARALNQYAGRHTLGDVLRRTVADTPRVDDKLRRKGRRARKTKPSMVP